MAVRRSNIPKQVTGGSKSRVNEAGTKAGKQFVRQPKSVARKTKKYRR